MKHEINISKVATIIIFIALLRTLIEPIRLNALSESSIEFEKIVPFLIAGLICTVGLLAMTILNYYQKYKLIILISVLIIIAMVVLKYSFGIE